jgi:hypothetical protein
MDLAQGQRLAAELLLAGMSGDRGIFEPGSVEALAERLVIGADVGAFDWNEMTSNHWAFNPDEL